ncbi:hypothetical protein BCR43DRAFT_510048 [Syncephalastrum racemosum]|uniref:Uncharacterized protein n=1 Tax=Syncephalastrum racemosum TaxID=13706 RepID=A0A1X2HTM5_SYNRA|nr:hypothetical protein BCR43DRAFT_510048 [Syncephalastrum racemosum]
MISSVLYFTLSLLALSLTTGALAAPATPVVNVVDHTTGSSGYGCPVVTSEPQTYIAVLWGYSTARISGQCDDPANVGCKEKRDLYQLHDETKTDGN